MVDVINVVPFPFMDSEMKGFVIILIMFRSKIKSRQALRFTGKVHSGLTNREKGKLELQLNKHDFTKRFKF